MNIKDITNTDNVNLSNCDEEPIHIPGTIQPHGVLLGVDKETKLIKFCSGNISRYLNISYEEALEKPLSKIFDLDKLQSFFQAPVDKVVSLKYPFSDKIVNLIAHSTKDWLIIELEPLNVEPPSQDLVDLSASFISSMQETKTLKELCDLITKSIKVITGYDRVVVYRFDEHYNGQVFSESKNDELESFLGLHYPHTDIPAQARELYLKNQLRVVADVNYTPVQIYTTTKATHASLDLSLSVLRSVSPIHIQYLKNMNVGATLTVSLILRGKLWGLINCLHHSPLYLPYDIRISTKLLAHIITSQIDSRNLNEEYEVEVKLAHTIEHFISKKFPFKRTSLLEIVSDPTILSVCNADGVAIYIGGAIYKFGETPEDSDIKNIANHLRNASSFSTYHADKDIPEIKNLLKGICGINFFSLRKDDSNSVIWFRKETIFSINWAGDPSKSLEKTTTSLTPRRSFERYCELVKNQSKVWLSSEIKTSLNFVNFLQQHINSILMAEEREQHLLANSLIQANIELENINYIFTHDLQEPLRKIQMTTSVLIQNEDSELSVNTIGKISEIREFAGRMQAMIKDVLKFTRLNYANTNSEHIDLQKTVESIKYEMLKTLTEKNASLNISELPEIEGNQFLIKQLFTNLIDNSLKFIDTSRDCKISISLSHDISLLPIELNIPATEYFIIRYIDNGIGFHASENEKVFRIFTRLDSNPITASSSIGLAICKKIMQIHNGYIFAQGNVNVGATFVMLFPKN